MQASDAPPCATSPYAPSAGVPNSWRHARFLFPFVCLPRDTNQREEGAASGSLLYMALTLIRPDVPRLHRSIGTPTMLPYSVHEPS